MPRRLSPDPSDRMGVYKRLSDVPERYRLTNHESEYEGRDVWNEYLSDHLFPEYPDAVDRFYRTARHCGDQWKEHMAGRDRHHALARPVDVAMWIETLLADRTVGTVYFQYWIRLEEFFTWLQSHADHPHVYHPALMAVSEAEAVQCIWDEKLDRRSHEERSGCD